MKNVDVEAAVATATAIPVRTVMSRAEKLRHWAGLVRKQGSSLYIYHTLEDWDRTVLDMPVNDYPSGGRSAFHVAADDPTFRAQGLDGNATFQGVMNFFELTQDQLHAFSCDCGGAISNRDMASRIEAIADGRPTLIQRAERLFNVTFG